MKKSCIRCFIRSFHGNLLINHWGAVLSAALLILHFTLGVPLWFFLVGFVGWIGIIALMTLLMTWVNSRPDIPEPHKVNKNPYSHK